MTGWRDRLPEVRGTLRRDVPLGPLTWLRVGGPAEVLFQPADAEDLAEFLAALPAEVPVLPMGVASNLLVRDGGIEGVVVRFGGPLAKVATEGDLVVAGAGALISERRRDILTFASKGWPDKLIGEELGITESTVRNHWHHIFRRLGVNNRTEAVTRALRQKII